MTAEEQDFLYNQVGIRIRKLRESAHITQDNFAAMLGLSRASIINIEKGRQRPTLHFLIDVAKSLKISLTELLSFLDDTKSLGEKIKSKEWKKAIALSTSGDPSTTKKLNSFLKELANK